MGRLLSKIILVFLSQIFLCGIAFAGSVSPITYQGRILKPDGTSLEAVTNFRFIIRAPNQCILWQEDRTIDMTGSKGAVSALVGAGTNSAAGSHSFSDVFNNTASFTGLDGCANPPNNYTPATIDDRTLIVSFNDGTGANEVPAMAIKNVPFSAYSSIAQSALGMMGKLFGGAGPTTDGQILVYDQADDRWEVRTPAAGGTVTAVGLDLGGLFNVANTPVTTFGTLTATLANQNANLVFAGPASGGAAAPTFRILVPIDIPNLDASKITSGTLSGVSLGTTGVSVGTFGSASSVATFAVQSDGRLTFAGSANIAIGAGQVSGTFGAGQIPDLNTAKITSGTFDQARIGILSPAAGGSGLNGASAANGQLLIGNGSGFSLGTITAGSNITVTSSAGGITIASSNSGGTVTQVNSGTGLSGGPITGAGTLSLANTAVTPGGYGTANYNSTFTVDQQGRLTAAGSTLIAISANQVTGGTINLAQIPDLDASKIVSGTLANARLPVSGVTAGAFSSSSYIPSFTVDSFGRLVSVGSNAISFPALQWSNVALGVNYASGSVGIGQASPVTMLDVNGAIRIANDGTACAAGLAGAIRYNAGFVEYCNGAGPGWQTLGISGSGVQSVNGLTANAQIFAVGSAGTLAAFTSGGSLHTLNIPLASTAGAAGGLVSNADYLVLMNGTIPSGRVADLDTAKITTGTFAQGRLGVVGNAAGGTGLDTSSATAGQILIGTGSGLALGTLSAGSNININNQNGTITISSSNSGGTVTQVNTGTGLSGGPFSAVGTITLADTAVTAGGYGNAAYSTTLTVDQQGRLTAAGSTLIAINGSQVTGGTINLAQIPDLDASKLVSGTLANARLPVSGVTAGAFSSSSYIPSFTVDAFGRLVSVGSNAISFPALQWTNVALGVNYATGSVGIGQASPATKLDINGAIRIANDGTACAAGLAGAIRYNAGFVEYCNGTGPGWQTLGISGSGVQSLNGLTANAQLFAVGSAGTLAAFTSGGSLHTLNIPLASTAGAAGGLLSNADYLTLTNGTIPAGRVADLDAGKITTGTFANARLPLSGASAGNVGSSTYIPTLSIDAFGRITSYGSAAVSIPAAITSINGLTASEQIFVVGSSGTLAAFSSAGSTNTLNIPLASGAGVAGGLLSNADYLTLTNGTIPAARVSDLDAAKITTGTFAQARLGVVGNSAGGTGLDTSSASAGQILIGTGSGFALGTLSAGSNININNQNGTITISSSNSGGTVTQVNTGAGLVGGPFSAVGTISLGTSGVSAGNYGSASQITTVAVDQYGRVTSASTVAVAIDANQVTSGTFANARLPVSGVTAGAFSSSTYVPSFTVDAYGRLVTVGSNAISFPALQWTNIPLGVNYASGSVGIGQANPVTMLDVAGAIRIANDATACAAGLAGAIRYNAGFVEYCNGTGPGWQTLGISGAGIQSLNGLTGNAQLFAVGSAGTLAAFSSAGTLHTLNIPLASTAGAAGGLLSNADYLTLTSGTIPSGRIADLDASKITSGTLGAVRGGTGVDGSAAGQGQLLIGTGSGYTLGTLINGSGISIVNQAGSITISATNSGSVTQVNTGAGLVGGPISGVGTISLGTTGVVAGSVGSASYIPQIVYDIYGRITAVGSTAISVTMSALSGTLGVSQGGTGLDASSAANGSFLIGNGTGFTLGTLVSSNGVLVATGAGSVGISTNAQVSNTFNTIVTRDGSGNFAAGQATLESLRLNNAGSQVTISNPLGAAYSMILPGTIGTPGQVLSTNGTNQLSWVNAPATGGLFLAGPGSAGTPSISFAADSNTGFFNPNSNEIGVALNGANFAQFTTTGVGIFVPLNVTNGSETSPEYSFTGDQDTGLWHPGANSLAISTQGTTRIVIDQTGQVGIGTSSPTDTLDVRGNARINYNGTDNSGVLRFDNGGAGGSSRIYGYDGVTASQYGFMINSNGNSFFGLGNTAGSVGIGTIGISAGSKLEVTGGAITAGNNGELRMMEALTNGTNSVSFRAPSALAQNYSIILPGTIGTPGQVLTTDGTGALSWTTVAAGATDLNSLSDAVYVPVDNSLYVGSTAGSSAVAGMIQNTAIGIQAFDSANNGTADFNTAVGFDSLGGNTSGIGNTGIGVSALTNNTDGDNNVAIGRRAFEGNLGGDESVAIGYLSGWGGGVTAANSRNTLVGSYSGFYLGAAGAGTDNTFLGWSAGQNNSTGDRNTFVGASAGFNNDSGSNNIMIGYNVAAPSVSGSNQLNIGNILYGIGISGTGGIASPGSIGIGTNTPLGKFHITSGAGAAPTMTADNQLVVQNTTSASAEAGITVLGGTTGFSTIAFGDSTNQYEAFIGSLNEFGDLRFATAGTERMRIRGNGSVGIGMSLPQAMLHVNGDARFANMYLAGTGTIGIFPGTLANYSLTLPSTVGSPGQVLTTNGTGALSWSTGSGGAPSYPLLSTTLGSVATPVYSFSADSDTGMYSPGIGTLAFTTNGTNRLNIASNGFVGIGTTTPNFKTQIVGELGVTSAPNGIHLADAWDNGNYGVRIAGKDNGSSGHDFYVRTRMTATGSFSDSLVVNSGGSVGIGTTNPIAKLDVNGNIRVGSGNEYTFGAAASSIQGYGDNNSGDSINFYTQYTNRMIINYSGQIGIGTSSVGTGNRLEVTGGAIAAGNGGELRMMENLSQGTNFVALRARGTLASDLTWLLPDSIGGAGQVMTVGSGGTLYWSSPSGSVTYPLLSTTLGSVATPVFSFSADQDTGIYSPGANQLALTTGGTARISINASGNVGIGTLSGATTLDVRSTTNNRLARFESVGTAYTQLDVVYGPVINQVGSDGFVGFVKTEGAYPLEFGTSDTPRLHITSIGSVGIGTTSPDASMDVEGAPAGFNAKFGATDRPGILNVGVNNEIWTDQGANGFASLDLNYRGYNGGFTQPRSFQVFNGQQQLIANFDGGTRTVGIGTVAVRLGNRLEVTGGAIAAGNGGEVRMMENLSQGTNFVAFKARGTLASDLTWLLPDSLGTAGNVMTVGSGGTLYWSAPAGSVSYPLLSTTLGSVATPAYSFAADPDTGIFSPGVGTIAISTNGAERLRINSSGLIGIGTQTATASLELGQFADTIPSFKVTSNPFTTTGSFDPIQFNSTYNSSTSNTGIITGLSNTLISDDNRSNNVVFGIYNQSNMASTGGNAEVVGQFNETIFGATSGSTGFAFSSRNRINVTGNNLIGSAYAVHASIDRSAGAVGNAYGVYIGNIDGTNRWGLYQEDATAQNYFAGAVGFGTTSVRAGNRLEVTGGAIAAGNGGELRMMENLSQGTNFVAFRARGTLASDLTWLLPDALGTSGQVMTVGSGGTLYWSAPSAGVTFPLLSTTLGSVATPVYSFSADPDTGLFSPGAGNIAVTSNGTVRMSINNLGIVSVGSPLATASLEVTGDFTTKNAGATVYPSFYHWAVSTNGHPANILQRARGTIESSPVAVADQDLLGTYIGRGYNGTQYEDAAYMRMAVDGTNVTGSGNHPGGRIDFIVRDAADTAQYVLTRQVMTIRNSGNVGIGTTNISAGSRLEVTGGAISAGNGGELRMMENLSQGPNYVALRARGTLASDLTWLLPDSLGTSGQVMTVGSGGTLYWSAPSGSVTFPLLSTTLGSVATPAYSFSGDSDTGLFSPGAGALAFATNGTSRINIDSGGSVGIGTTTPTSRFTVEKSISSITAYEPTANVRTIIDTTVNDNDTAWGFSSFLNLRGAFDNNNSETAGISGNVVVEGSGNKGKPSGLFGSAESLGAVNAHVVGVSSYASRDSTGDGTITGVNSIAANINASGNAIGLRGGYFEATNGGNTTQGYGVISNYINSGGVTSFAYGLSTSVTSSSGSNTVAYGIWVGNVQGQQKWSLYATDATAPSYIAGSLGIGTDTPSAAMHVVGDIVYTGSLSDISDRRLKENIAPLANGLDVISQIPTYSYTMKSDPKHKVEFGVMAQDVQTVLPELVRSIDPKTDHKGVSYIGFIPWLIKSVQELDQRTQNSCVAPERVKDLEIENQNLRRRMASVEEDNKAVRAELDDLKKKVEALLAK